MVRRESSTAPCLPTPDASSSGQGQNNYRPKGSEKGGSASHSGTHTEPLKGGWLPALNAFARHQKVPSSERDLNTTDTLR
jgi:hypothetical protein